MGNSIEGKNIELHETESVFHISYPVVFEALFKNGIQSYIRDHTLYDECIPTIGCIYSAISEYLGFGSMGNGKTMGLSSYGKEDKNIKPFIVNNTFDTSLFYRDIYGLKFIPYDYVKLTKEETLNGINFKDASANNFAASASSIGPSSAFSNTY
jgi:predicted NodU family carbamoyl transferase